MDEIQAGLLRVRLCHMQELQEERERICCRYLSEIRNSKIVLPTVLPGATHVWHQFVVRCEERDALAGYLKEKGVGTIIHYPIPPHLAEAYAYLGYKKGAFPITETYADTVLSLPLYIGMTSEEQEYVVECINGC